MVTASCLVSSYIVTRRSKGNYLRCGYILPSLLSKNVSKATTHIEVLPHDLCAGLRLVPLVCGHEVVPLLLDGLPVYVHTEPGRQRGI